MYDINDPDIIIEGMTAISAVINAINSGLSDRCIKRIIITDHFFNKKRKEYSFLLHNSEILHYPIVKKNVSENETIIDNSSGGITAVCSIRNIPELNSTLISENGIYALLDGIEDPYNYAYTIRSFYAAGFDGIIIPPRNWDSASGIVVKSSAGTSELIPTYQKEPVEAIKLFKQKGYTIISAGIRDSVSLFDTELRAPLLLVIGGEKRGISRSLLELTDITVRIDYGRKFLGSLTTASSAAVLAFEIMRQNNNLSKKG